MTGAAQGNGSAAPRWGHVAFIGAGAGSGKTHRLIGELEGALLGGSISPAGIVGTTFTVKAATELRERAREGLLRAGHPELSERIAEARIGTVHSVCQRLLARFAFELGLSPQLDMLSIADGTRFFRQAIDQVLPDGRAREMNALAQRIGMAGDARRPDWTWQSVVKEIADKARENDIGPEALRAMGERNAEAMLAFFGTPLAETATPALRDAIARARAQLPEPELAGVRKYRDMLDDAAARLGRDDCCWTLWMRLAGETGPKAIAAHTDGVRRAAAAYERHPDFQADLRGFLRGVFDTAAAALDRFQAVKRERALIDFADMEQLLLHALDREDVREQLRGEVQLLLVDEFQDTNPMQLALFLKLAALADRAIFVGDVKQAIYEFRGCDPDLVFATLKGLARGSAATDTLDANWRSRPALVRYVNAIFEAAFAELPRAQVALSPRRSEMAAPAVVAWTLPKRLAERARAIAGAVAALVAGGQRIADPETGVDRPISYGDIAVLARTNSRVEAIAEALRAANTPMKMTLRGLLETPEAHLATACLRRIADRADTLASAEIMALADGAEPEVWLADRLDWLAGGGKDIAWGEDAHPLLARLKALRERSALRSPVELVAGALNEADIRRIVAAWGPDDVRAAQRQKNLDALLDLAVEYEKHAAAQRAPGTLTGFLFWLENPHSPDLDLQPAIAAGDAVHVLTYHRAKGLEWPVVVCADFESEAQSRTWGVRVEQARAFDIDAPLQGRELRYWPNIFGRRRKGVPARRAIETSAEGARCRAGTLAEQRRLAYVGMTRARDQLILALANGAPKDDAWLASFAADFAIPAAQRLTLPGGIDIPSRAETFGADAPPRPPRPYRPRWFAARERAAPPPAVLAPSSAPEDAGGAIGRILECGPRVALQGDEMADAGTALHAAIAAELVQALAPDAAVARAQRILQALGAGGRLAPGDAVAIAARLRRCLEERLGAQRIEAEVPISHLRGDGRVVRGFIDALAHTPRGVLVIDHKSSPQRRSAWRAEALRHAGQLRLYRDALAAAGWTVAGCFVHFAVTGGLVEVLPDAQERSARP